MQISFLSQILVRTENQLDVCKVGKDEFQGFDWATFLSDQKYGLIFGTIITWFLSSIDQRYAVNYANKHNLKQNVFFKLLCPTLISLIQVKLRKRNKNSRLAAILSILKKSWTISSNSFAQCYAYHSKAKHTS